MLKKTFLCLSLILISHLAEAASSPSPLTDTLFPSFKKKIKIPVVILDPGHGGNDFGTISEQGLNEKEVVLDIAHKTRVYLESLGFTVIMTRQDDRFISLSERAKMTEQNDPDIFVSIHANASKTNKQANGFETFFLSPNKQEQGIEKYKGGLSYFGLSAQSKKSLKLAKDIQHELAAVLDTENRGIKMSHFAVLRESSIPAVLVETGFLSNPKEAEAFADSNHRKKVAFALARSIQHYMGW